MTEVVVARADRADADELEPEVVDTWDAFQAALAAYLETRARAHHPAGSNLRS